MQNLFSPVPEKRVSYSLDHVELVNHRRDSFNVYWTYAVSDLFAGFVVFGDPPVVSRYIWPPLTLSPQGDEASPDLILGPFLCLFLINRFNSSVVARRDYLDGVPERQELVEGILGVEPLTVPTQAPQERWFSHSQVIRCSEGILDLLVSDDLAAMVSKAAIARPLLSKAQE